MKNDLDVKKKRASKRQLTPNRDWQNRKIEVVLAWLAEHNFVVDAGQVLEAAVSRVDLVNIAYHH